MQGQGLHSGLSVAARRAVGWGVLRSTEHLNPHLSTVSSLASGLRGVCPLIP